MNIQKWAVRSLCAGLVAASGCSTVDANVVYDSANDIRSKVGLAQADLKTCKTDTTKCAQLDQDLQAIDETSKNLQNTAVAAGYSPGITSAPPTTTAAAPAPAPTPPPTIAPQPETTPKP